MLTLLRLVTSFTLTTLCCMMIFSPTPSLATSNMAPHTVLQQFYKAVNEKRCESAVLLRKDYTVERCKQITEVIIHEADTVFNNGTDAVILISIDIYTTASKSYFLGYVRLQKHEANWEIMGPYKSQQRYTLDEYVNDYLPEVENAQNTLTTELPAVAEQDPIEDSLEALSPQHNENDLALEKYLTGTQEIAGNYTALLNELRTKHPTSTQGHVLLIDRSRLSLYLYDKNNLLLAFFPILSLSIEQIPNGLYSLNTAQQTANNENTPVHLNHLQSLDKSLNNTDNIYYIRDLLDNDTAQSLLLSPIDLGKLRKLLSHDAIIYLGD